MNTCYHVHIILFSVVLTTASHNTISSYDDLCVDLVQHHTFPYGDFALIINVTDTIKTTPCTIFVNGTKRLISFECDVSSFPLLVDNLLIVNTTVMIQNCVFLGTLIDVHGANSNVTLRNVTIDSLKRSQSLRINFRDDIDGVTDSTVTVLDSVLMNGAAALDGGCVLSNSSRSLTFVNSTVTNCTVLASGNMSNTVRSAGCIGIERGTLALLDSTVSFCAVENLNGGSGGCIEGFGESMIQIVKTNVNNCIAKTGTGGWISGTQGTSLSILHSTIGNCSSRLGGGCLFTSNKTVILNSSFAECTSSSGACVAYMSLSNGGQKSLNGLSIVSSNFSQCHSSTVVSVSSSNDFVTTCLDNVQLTRSYDVLRMSSRNPLRKARKCDDVSQRS